MTTFSNLKRASCKGVDKQKDESSKINFIFFVTVTKKILDMKSFHI